MQPCKKKKLELFESFEVYSNTNTKSNRPLLPPPLFPSPLHNSLAEYSPGIESVFGMLVTTMDFMILID